MAPAPEKYDLVVLGGGSGGLAASKEAAAHYGKKVALVDFVQPTPKGTTWGLGGTCVNVGCIPKKLMHEAALVGERIEESHYYGWGQACDGEPFVVGTTEKVGNVKHNWQQMVDRVQANIKSSNFKYRVEMREKKVNYINAYGRFIDSHTMELTNKKGEKSHISADTFIIATGERPRYPDNCEGSSEYSITSDDLFSLPYNPGKTLVVGASYVALECAGFLAGLGNDVTVMVRSILLRGFDQEMAEKVGKYMSDHGVHFLRPCVPTKIEQIKEGEPGLYRVIATDNMRTLTREYNTVLFAIGRQPGTSGIGLEKAGVHVNPKTGKIPTKHEQTNVEHIYALGDVLEFRAELTPVAIDAALKLVRRLYGGQTKTFDYINIPTVVFTPNEYGCVGLSEESARAKYGDDGIEVFHTYFKPFERGLNERPVDCYAKLICVIKEKMRVVGFHYLGPNAGEVTQFVPLAIKLGATKADFDDLVGIHPSSAELFTNMTVTKRSGESPYPRGCCG
ncbi:Thioredoxin reductase 1, cytoplasmic, partial [Fragariocoptes setiger]